jgi:hypothetical protein
LPFDQGGSCVLRCWFGSNCKLTPEHENRW